MLENNNTPLTVVSENSANSATPNGPICADAVNNPSVSSFSKTARELLINKFAEEGMSCVKYTETENSLKEALVAKLTNEHKKFIADLGVSIIIGKDSKEALLREELKVSEKISEKEASRLRCLVDRGEKAASSIDAGKRSFGREKAFFMEKDYDTLLRIKENHDQWYDLTMQLVYCNTAPSATPAKNTIPSKKVKEEVKKEAKEEVKEKVKVKVKKKAKKVKTIIKVQPLTETKKPLWRSARSISPVKFASLTIPSSPINTQARIEAATEVRKQNVKDKTSCKSSHARLVAFRTARNTINGAGAGK